MSRNYLLFKCPIVVQLVLTPNKPQVSSCRDFLWRQLYHNIRLTQCPFGCRPLQCNQWIGIGVVYSTRIDPVHQLLTLIAGQVAIVHQRTTDMRIGLTRRQ